MNTLGLSASEAHITAQIDALMAKDPEVRTLAIRSARQLDWPPMLTRRDRRFELRWCESRLALREALLAQEETDADTRDGLVLLTPLGDQDVPADVIARLARGKVFQPQGWTIVRELFSAQGTDARLGEHDWMPQVLVDAARQGPYTPVTSGFLDADTAWREVLTRHLQLDSARPDIAMLLTWSLRPDANVRLSGLPDKARQATLGWMTRHAGPSGEMVLRCIDAGRLADVLPLGLVCGVVFAPEGEGEQSLSAAAVRLERYVGQQPIGIEPGRRWAADARQLVQTLSIDTCQGALDRADLILRDLHIAEHAHLSDLLPSGLEQRLARYAEALQAHLKRPSESTIAQVEDTCNSVLLHHLGTSHGLRMERVRMARRLARWWLRPAWAGPTDLDSLAAQQADDAAFVDWARSKLLGGDELASLSSAYAQLRARVQDRREANNQVFAASLSQALSSARGSTTRSIGLEDTLDRLVAPLARQHPVLLLVVDGLSLSIFRELFERIERQGWSERVRSDATRPHLGIAVLPTITMVSRTSLLTGRVSQGQQTLERQGFSTHGALVQSCTGRQKPRLFHKGDLSEDGHLATEVRQVIGDVAHRVVGVVYNAVDDHLSGPEQLQQRWRLEDLRLLLPMLQEAKAARRVLVVTADHGHVLEDGSRAVSTAGPADGDRWRTGRQASVPEELVLKGHRVRTPDGDDAVVTLWSEKARYTGRKNGYHGGASPAEVVVPMSVFAPFGLTLVDWQPAPPQQPEWWDLPGSAVAATPAKLSAKATGRRNPATPTAAPVPQATLFAADEAPVPVPAAEVAHAATSADWISNLLSTSVYASQRQLAARMAMPDDQMRRLLWALDERGGKLGKAALAQRMSLQEMRLAGFLSVARRLLNVDQAPVLSVDEDAGVVELNRELLMAQFQLDTPSRTRKGAP
ncbi:BREX-2 system phosphatase PglZ [Sphaerotilus mobilis]|uniref:PglZ domain-containing protein n=1 Tax=Sphaerotilus mobilis TaxID=47994 RepID=A0A4Q7LUP2_9BURK|nr:BREX-2 system phosphatase PglZ [Sphaerotilus mobilis]RZS57947.1 PglZ domain-containing protein [Sphaerotilus mobilis]